MGFNGLKTALRLPLPTKSQPLPKAFARPPPRMPLLDNLELTWLGTSAGCPTKTRNVSSTALRLDGEIWLVDVGEATQHQIQRSHLKISAINKIACCMFLPNYQAEWRIQFLTHMHGDHSFGLVPLLCALADGAGGVVDGDDPRDSQAQRSPPLDIYGLTGTRRLVRTTLECTYTHLARRYRVHELLFDQDKTYTGTLHHNEMPGQDLRINGEGYWSDIVEDGARMKVSAAPIKHTVPCVGFVFEEPPRPGTLDPALYKPALERNRDALLGPPWNLRSHMQVLARLKDANSPIILPDGTALQPPEYEKNGRKLVILGDTYDAESSGMDQIANGADIVVHEATNAYLPDLDGTIKEGDTYEALLARTRSHGHSTPQVAGAFAKRVDARNLFLNHFSARYADVAATISSTPGEGHGLDEHVTVTQLGSPDIAGRDEDDKRLQCMLQIEQQASEAWASGRKAVATRDFMTVVVKRKRS